jgi:hypothetical protein
MLYVQHPQRGQIQRSIVDVKQAAMLYFSTRPNIYINLDKFKYLMFNIKKFWSRSQFFGPANETNHGG